MSGAYAPGSGPETYIFPSNEVDVTDWNELTGSFRGGIDHAKALYGAGYETVIDDNPAPNKVELQQRAESRPDFEIAAAMVAISDIAGTLLGRTPPYEEE